MKIITMYHNLNILLTITVFIFLLSQGLSHAKEWPFNYSAINVWPLPINVTLPSNPLGPHVINIAEATIDPSCDIQIATLATEALHLATVFLAPVQTYAEEPYATRRNAECTKRCMKDMDCNNGKCYVKSNIRWNSTHPCSPSSAFNAPCGCCTTSPSLPEINELIINCNTPSTFINNNNGNKDTYKKNNNFVKQEIYEIDISNNNKIIINSYSSHGAANALSTLAQIFRYDTILKYHVVDIVPLYIFDAPLHEWRGFMLDTSRHFIPKSIILNLIKAMSASKLNVFHWHMVDSPSFPYESEKYPELSKEGAWGQSMKNVYTKEDIQNVVAYGKNRYVKIMIEIDTPAHTLSIARSHPEMMPDGCFEWMANSQYKIDVDSDDCMAIDPTNDAARTMVANLLQEVAELVGEEGTHIHIGGDEVKFDCWRASEAINNIVTKRYGNTSDASFSMLQAEWTANVTGKAIIDAKKKVVLWQPTTLGPGDPAWDGKLPKDAVYMVWLNEESAAAYANSGSDVIVTTPYYVAGMGSSGWLDVYNADLLPSGLKPGAEKHILGGEICMWGESLNQGNLAMRSLQIGAAAAEPFWRKNNKGSGPGSPNGVGLSDRYNRFLCYLSRFGIEVPPIMPSYCDVVVG